MNICIISSQLDYKEIHCRIDSPIIIEIVVLFTGTPTRAVGAPLGAVLEGFVTVPNISEEVDFFLSRE